MMGPAMMPSTVTAAPTIPVAMAKIVEVMMTTMYSEPRIGASIMRRAENNRPIRPACSVRKPMKMNSGTAASTSSFIRPMVWK